MKAEGPRTTTSHDRQLASLFDSPQVLIGVSPIAGESLLSFLANTAIANGHETIAHILLAAGAPHYRALDLVYGQSVEPARLAWTLRANTDAVMGMVHAPTEIRNGLNVVSFNSTIVPAYDLSHRARRVSPTSLQASDHHRAIWMHGLIPFCRESGEFLIETCPACGERLGWHSIKGISLCDKCSADLRTAPTRQIRDSEREALMGITALLDEDARQRESSIGRLPVALRHLASGEIFELGWQLARMLRARRNDLPRPRHKSLSSAEIIETLVQADGLLLSWPACIDDAMRSWSDTRLSGRASRKLSHLRTMSSPRTSWPAIAKLMRLQFPQIDQREQTLLRGLSAGLVKGGEAARLLKVAPEHIPALNRSNVLRGIVERGEVNLHATFATYDLEPIAQIISDRFTYGSVAENLGITWFGVEQMICQGDLVQRNEPAIIVIYGPHFVTRTSFDGFLAKLLEGRSDAVEDPLPLRKAMAAIGGREKPWGPVLRALVDGKITYSITGTGNRVVDRISISRDDQHFVDTLTFDRTEHPTFDFTGDMPRKDAEDLLNLSPRELGKALMDELANSVKCATYRLDNRPLQQMARARISRREVAARFLDHDLRQLKVFARSIGIDPAGSTGWARHEIEHRLS